MNRGSKGPTPSAGPPHRRFNEAPIHESGKCRRTGRGLGASHSFNEAPIHESGKLGSTCHFACRNGSFNEAPIHESGK